MATKVFLRPDAPTRCEVRGSSGGSDYSGILTIEPDGDAWKLLWEIDRAGMAMRLQGVGLATEDAFIVGRAEASDDPDNDSPGVVIYDIRRFGHLPARWYHPTLRGRQGAGLSIDGPTAGLVGLYRAEYRSQVEDFEPLVKEIRPKGDHLEFDWRTETASQYVGCGRVYGTSLVAAWARPGIAFDLIRYGLDRDRFQGSAEAITYGLSCGGRERFAAAR